jgi:hypothetical protein
MVPEMAGQEIWGAVPEFYSSMVKVVVLCFPLQPTGKRTARATLILSCMRAQCDSMLLVASDLTVPSQLRYAPNFRGLHSVTNIAV